MMNTTDTSDPTLPPREPDVPRPLARGLKILRIWLYVSVPIFVVFYLILIGLLSSYGAPASALGLMWGAMALVLVMAVGQLFLARKTENGHAWARTVLIVLLALGVVDAVVGVFVESWGGHPVGNVIGIVLGVIVLTHVASAEAGRFVHEHGRWRGTLGSPAARRSRGALLPEPGDERV